MKTFSVTFSAVIGSVAFLALPVFAQAPNPMPVASAPGHFYQIQLQHYDAGMIANLIAQPDGIIVVPPNYVISGQMPSSGFSARRGGSSPAALPAPVKSAAAAPVLPQGIKRIFALESNNSLVIETTP